MYNINYFFVESFDNSKGEKRMNIFEKMLVCLVIGGSLAYVQRFVLENSAMFGLQLATIMFFAWVCTEPLKEFTIRLWNKIRHNVSSAYPVKLPEEEDEK